MNTITLIKMKGAATSVALSTWLQWSIDDSGLERTFNESGRWLVVANSCCQVFRVGDNKTNYTIDIKFAKWVSRRFTSASEHEDFLSS